VDSPRAEQPLPEKIETELQLEELLTRPRVVLQDFIKTLQSPLIILGAGGKMGPTLALLARRAADAAKHPLEIIAVSRFRDSALISKLNGNQIRTITCDLLDANALRRLPDAQNVIYLVGLKFGTAQDPSTTWAINTIVPTQVAERFCNSRIVALSTGNVYPLSEVSRGGSAETDPLTPLGEYANSAVARERIFEFHSRAHRTPIALIRLFYAVELRYGVLLDIARKVHGGVPIDLANGYFNCIWQGDANEMILRALAFVASPPTAWNLCRREVFSVRTVASQLGSLLERAPKFIGQESPAALLGNPAAICDRLGAPTVPLEPVLGWVASWVKRGGRDLGKPTHFEARDGRY
jgi:nucleoside-diphosphate-sugar epimerase